MTFKLLLRCLKNSVSGMYVYKNPWNGIPKICGLYAYVIVMKTSVSPAEVCLFHCPRCCQKASGVRSPGPGKKYWSPEGQEFGPWQWGLREGKTLTAELLDGGPLLRLLPRLGELLISGPHSLQQQADAVLQEAKKEGSNSLH